MKRETFGGYHRADWYTYALSVAERYHLAIVRQTIESGHWLVEVEPAYYWIMSSAGLSASMYSLTREIADNLPLDMSINVRAVGGSQEVGRFGRQLAINTTALATVIATMRAQRTEARALRKELQHSPTGYSVAVWQAYVASNAEYEFEAQPLAGETRGKMVHTRRELTAAMLRQARHDVETGAYQIPARILRHAGQLYGDAR